MKKELKRSIVIFIVVLLIAIFLIINKGHIGKYSLVYTGEKGGNNQEQIMPKLTLETAKDYLSVSDKKDSSEMTVSIDGEIVTEGVEFESSDEDIAKIEDNKIIPVGEGKAVITAKYDGLEATDDIRVITPIKTMTFTTTNSTVKVDKDLQLKLKVTPSNACIDTLSYTSSDEGIAKVNSNGIVTGVSAGKVTITVTDSYTGMEKTVNLTIRK